MADISRPVDPEWTKQDRWTAALYAAIAAVAPGAILARIYYPEDVSLAVTIVVVLLCGGLGVTGLLMHRAAVRYKVEISDYGIRRSDRTEWIPWSGFLQVRVRLGSRWIKVRLGDADPFDLYLSLEAAVSGSRASA